ncbi:MAG: FG-GAP-like repeat-containing protein [Bacteriovoracaceae bacterium]
MSELTLKLRKDPRYTVFLILFSYLVLGFTVLGFNRTPWQALATSCAAMALELAFAFTFKKDQKWFFPISALITSTSLSLLLNYSHNYYLLLVPVFFAIGAKYVFTFNGKHIFNPAQVGVTLSLIFCGQLITAAPAYQWYGIESIAILIVALGVFFVIPTVKRVPLVLSFLTFYTLQTLLRALIMRHHLPFQTLFLGSISSPAFFLFTFFMITDPQTSPSDPKQQIKAGAILATLDLIFHIRRSYYTFFFAGFTFQSYKLISAHYKAMRASGSFQGYFKQKFIDSGYYKRLLTMALIIVTAVTAYHTIIAPKLSINNLNFTMEATTPEQTGIDSKLGDALYRTDKRLHHIIKWILSVGDSVATGDYDGDGKMDLFFTHVLKRDSDRGALYHNLGNFHFERISLPASVEERFKKVEQFGLLSNALFVDFDDDGDNDLFLTYAFGSPLLLKNLKSEKGEPQFMDVTKDLGLDTYTNSISANFFDMNNDGKLDLVVGNVWPTHLPDYPKDKPELLNVFHLPQEEYKGDVRPYNFMHKSWHLADNGGVNDLYLQTPEGKFQKLDSAAMGMPEHYWTLAIGTADINQDGFVDLYMANDFGPDNFYLNQAGKHFKKVEGKFFGDLGRDTYKGMNASIEDFNGDGFQDIYISNVHHELQAEGSLLWTFNKDEFGNLTFKDQATKWGALNEDRFGWGASIADFNNDGYLDIVQANGMVDDLPDKKFDSCKDYWYTNEKIARSPPEIHRYIHYWGDIRGYCIYPNEKNRFYLNTGNKEAQMFVDVAEGVGLTQEANSRGVSSVDLDNDGRMDLVITNQFTPADILRNKAHGDDQGEWLGLTLVSKVKGCNRMALGSKLKLTYEYQGIKKVLYKEAKLANGFSAQNDPRIHFGLGKIDRTKPISLEVNWCNQTQKSYDLKTINQYSILEFTL